MSKELYILDAHIYTPESVIEYGALKIENGKITAIYTKEEAGQLSLDSANVIKASGNHLIPGFIDVHVHGGGGGDFMDVNPEAHEQICRYHAERGTTSLLATTVTESKENLINAVRAISNSFDKPAKAARIWGIHLEGPFMNHKRTGAQNPQFLRKPDLDELKMYWELSGGNIRQITVAPELEGAESLIRWAAEHGITVSIGHSDATMSQVDDAIDWGASHVTHMFNGMRPLHHREPGVAGTALLRDELTVEMICDGIHIHPELIGWVLAQKPKHAVVCITDCMSAAGMPVGEYFLGGLKVQLHEDGQVRLIDENGNVGSLAGSTLNMHTALLNVIKFTGKGLHELLPYFTSNPARQAGAAHVKGVIKVGMDADLVLLDEHLDVRNTIVEGNIVYEK